MNVKERVYEAFIKKNYFEYGKKDSLEVFEKASAIEDLVLEMERNCNVDHLFFRYNSKTGMFHRLLLTEKDKELRKREIKYWENHHKVCTERQCFSEKIDVDTFIALLEFVFEPIGVYEASELET